MLFKPVAVAFDRAALVVGVLLCNNNMLCEMMADADYPFLLTNK